MKASNTQLTQTKGSFTVVEAATNLSMDISKALGGDGIKELEEQSESFGVFLNGAHHLAKVDDQTNNLFNTALRQSESVTSIFIKLRNTYFDGLITKKGELVVDPEAIDAGIKAGLKHDELFNAIAVQEKQLHIEKTAAEAQTTPAKLVAGMNGNKRRSLFGLTVGCPTLATLRAGHYKELKSRVTKAVKSDHLTEEAAKEFLKSYKVDKEINAWVLAPVETAEDKMTDDEKKEAEKKAAQAKLEKLINQFCELDAASQTLFLQAVGTHSHDIADLIINAAKGFEAKKAEDESKVEEVDQEAEAVADFRELKREMEQIDKGNKKLTAAQKRKAKSEFAAAKKALEDKGIDTSKL